jgi:predicted phage-related endonuclease
VDELSKQILLEEEINMPTVNLNHTQNSTVSLAFGSQQMVTSSINIENVEDIHKIIEDIKKELEIIEMDKEDKENLFDDLDVVDEQINSSVEKPTRLKKAYNNISSFLEKSTSVITKSTALALGIQKLIELVSPIIK